MKKDDSKNSSVFPIIFAVLVYMGSIGNIRIFGNSVSIISIIVIVAVIMGFANYNKKKNLKMKMKIIQMKKRKIHI